MSELQDFIIANGVLQRYRGNSMDVVIPDGVHTIEMLAFSRESKAIIENIQFPRTLERIEEWAFDHCDNLTGIVIPGVGHSARLSLRAIRKSEMGHFAGLHGKRMSSKKQGHRLTAIRC